MVIQAISGNAGIGYLARSSSSMGPAGKEVHISMDSSARPTLLPPSDITLRHLDLLK